MHKTEEEAIAAAEKVKQHLNSPAAWSVRESAVDSGVWGWVLERGPVEIRPDGSQFKAYVVCEDTGAIGAVAKQPQEAANRAVQCAIERCQVFLSVIREASRAIQ